MALPTLAIYGIPDRDRYALPRFTHDHSITLMENGIVKTHIALERHTGIKNDNTLHRHIDGLIESGLLELPEKFDLVSVNSYVGNEFLSSSGSFRFKANRQAALHGDLVEAYGWLAKENNDNRIAEAFLCEHELAQVFSVVPFYPEIHDKSLFVHFDGGASLSSFSAYIYDHSNARSKFTPIKWNWDLIYLARLFDDNPIVFEILNEGVGAHFSAPGKLMGLAPYGKENEKLRLWLRKNKFFEKARKDKTKFNRGARAKLNYSDINLNTETEFSRDIAFAIQQEFSEVLTKTIYDLHEKTGAEYLYLSGGCALNIVTNSQIVQSGPFKDVFISPACNDAGLSLGAAAFLEWKKYGSIERHSPYLNNFGLNSSYFDFSASTIKEVADIILRCGIVGVCNGHGEIGPRALGNRSIIALADSIELKNRVSITCKGREYYRPVAPIMLDEAAQELTGTKAVHHLAKFMLLDLPVREQFHQSVQGVVHVDGSSRIQKLDRRQDNPFMYDLLKYLHSNHRVACLINTSFNRRGAPIVHRNEDALELAQNMSLDGVVIQGKLTKLRT
jgi:carbamoyltransferase